MQADLFRLSAGRVLHFYTCPVTYATWQRITGVYISSRGNPETMTVMHRCITYSFSQTKLIGTLPNTGHGVQLHQPQLQKRKLPHKNRWVSTERNDGTATGAVSDWSIASLSKPFF